MERKNEQPVTVHTQAIAMSTGWEIDWYILNQSELSDVSKCWPANQLLADDWFGSGTGGNSVCIMDVIPATKWHTFQFHISVESQTDISHGKFANRWWRLFFASWSVICDSPHQVWVRNVRNVRNIDRLCCSSRGVKRNSAIDQCPIAWESYVNILEHSSFMGLMQVHQSFRINILDLKNIICKHV